MIVLETTENDYDTDNQMQETLISRTHGRIIAVIKAGKKTFDEQSHAIQLILEEAFQDLEEETEELLLLKDAFIKDLTETNAELLKRINRIGDENDILTQNHDFLKDKFETLERDTKRLKIDFNNLNDKNLSTEIRYTDLKKKTDALQSDSSDLKQKYEELEEKYDELNDENQSLKSKSDLLEEEGENLYCDYDQLDEKYKKLRDETDTLKHQYTKLESQYAELKDETETWSVRYEDLNADYSKLQKIVDDALEAQKKQRIKQEKNLTDPHYDKFGSCASVLNFVGKQLWASMPLFVRLIVQYGYEQHNRP